MAMNPAACSRVLRAGTLRPQRNPTTDTTMNGCLGDVPATPAIRPALRFRTRPPQFLPVFLALAVSTSTGAAAQSAPSTADPACQVAAADSLHPLTPPRPRVEQMPPDGPNRPRGTFSISVRVTQDGRIDTSAVAISPAMPARYEVAFRRSLLKYRFYPARRKDCAVSAPFRYTLVFD